ncbi:hypothetical protein NBRC110019_00910 [Neptunitalea chrysea]|uniref:Uncharacterized protein n=1 Tax=Neptunitalea chrysea TaxID=1647581 RepID=A0A9W6EU93_9FLAO|nr:hypothetical protein [Neptunitalea chrysea]GLB51052.1 hypothetical protein NBRC110019_00910 [Neptunitalea chrysea]
MKVPIAFYLFVTTLLLVTVVAMVGFEVPLRWIFGVTVVGQVILVLMVYRVLRDDYVTNKTFNDLYEDRPIERY